MRLALLPGTWRLAHDPAGDVAALGDAWLALVRAPEGLTAVLPAEAATPPAERWRALHDAEAGHGLDVPGLLASVVAPLADAGLPVFVCSTFHADLVLVGAERVGEAAAALRAAGHALDPAARDDRAGPASS